MKRRVLALALLLAACSSGGDRYLPEFDARQVVAQPNGPVTFTVAPSGGLYFVELRTNDLYEWVRGGDAQRLFNTGHKPDSLVVDNNGTLFVAARTKEHRLVITQYRYPPTRPTVIWNGPMSLLPAHMTISSKNELLVGYAGEIFKLDRTLGIDQKPQVISSGYTDPVVVAPRGGSRIWVADNGRPGEKERVGRGREGDVAKRNRFASVLPAFTNPSGMALIRDELLLCSKTRKQVYRLHIGLDEVARRRGYIAGLFCDRDIGVSPSDGGIYTSASGKIYYYPPA